MSFEYLSSELKKVVKDKRHRAYMLATVKHECANTWRPIVERGNRNYFDKYEHDTRIGQRLGNTQPGDGYKYLGRGYVQITGRGNYAKFQTILDVNLVDNPDLALKESVAMQIMVIGMSKGIFTGKKLSDYINDSVCDYHNARRIINGLDQARLIASYAKDFYYKDI